MKNSAKKIVTVITILVMTVFTLLLPFQQISAQQKKPAKKPDVNKPAGNKPDANRSVPNKPDAKSQNVSKPSVNKSDNKSVGNRDAGVGSPGGKTNNVNIDNSKKNVNVNVDNSKDIHVNNSRNTSVRRNTRPYSRPPHIYGGYRYRAYNPYFYHPYRPFVWGPRWHPWGFFIATLAATAIIVSIVDNDMDMPGDFDMAANYNSGFGFYPRERQPALSGPAFISYQDYQDNSMDITWNARASYDGEYYYDEGVFYLKGNGGYTVVSAPLGGKIKTLPSGYETITVDDAGTKNYYYGGAFYIKSGDGYKVVAPLSGSVVEHVSEGGEEVKMGDVTYIKFGDTFFQPIQKDGKDMYEVVDVEKED